MNKHGIALEQFHLGYLYETYAKHLSTPQAQITYEADCGNMTETLFRERAKQLFKSAYQAFEEKEHLKGMYLAKKHEANLYEEGTTEHNAKVREYLNLQAEYFKYIRRHGYEKCSYIPRQHGDEISLLTEIVEENGSQSLFYAKQETSSYENQAKDNRKVSIMVDTINV